MKKIFAYISQKLKQDEEIQEILIQDDFKPAFMKNRRIVDSGKKIWKLKGEEIQQKEHFLFLLETRNKKTNEIVFGGQELQSERDLYLYIY